MTILGSPPAFPQASGGAVLTLNNLFSSNSDPVAPHRSDAGFRFETNGQVEELVGGWVVTGGVWTPQNAGVEWISDGGATASSYRVIIGKTGGSGNVVGPPLGSWWNLGSAGNEWVLTNTTSGDLDWFGTATIEEIGTPANTVNCTISLSCTNSI